MKLKIIFDDVNNFTWAIRVVETGDKFGRNDALTHTGEIPLVEFYDTRFDHTDYGQFVSRYNMDTLMGHVGALCVDTASDNWCLYSSAMARLRDWLRDNYPQVKPTSEG